MLTLANVSYRYVGAGRKSLRDINLTVGDGEVVGVVGASESGKTTLALVCSGLAPRSIGGQLDGALLVDEEDVVALPMHEMAARVGICLQNPSAQLSLVADTVFEEVAFGPLNLGLQRTEVALRVTESLDALGISELAERDPRRLSGGQLQLVAVAGLLAMRPRHLVLDEPTAQLDPDGKRLVADALASLSATGTGLLITEHDTDLLTRLCTQVIAIDQGAIALDGDAATVLADPRLEELGVARSARARLESALATAGVSVELPE